MGELIPLPPPERGSNWNPEPARCGECGEIIDAHPASRADGRWTGWCQIHGEVVATYRDDDEKGEEDA